MASHDSGVDSSNDSNSATDSITTLRSMEQSLKDYYKTIQPFSTESTVDCKPVTRGRLKTISTSNPSSSYSSSSSSHKKMFVLNLILIFIGSISLID